MDKTVIERAELAMILAMVRQMLPDGTAAYVAVFDADPVGARGVDIGGCTDPDLPFHVSVVLRNLARTAAKKVRVAQDATEAVLKKARGR